jgi:hypothetical protein
VGRYFSIRIPLSAGALCSACLLATSSTAWAQGAAPAAPAAAAPAGTSARPVPPPPPPSDETAGTGFKDRFVLDTGRVPVAPPKPDTLHIQIHGQYQLRLTGLSDLPLAQFGGDAQSGSLGQTVRLVHWLRITPRLQFRDKLQVVGQLDVPRGFIAGQTTRHVQAAEHAMDKRQPLELAPRWLYLDWMSPVGLVRVGQQPSHWGMGILANDGDHPTLFGDYRDGSIVERVLFATRPGGKDSPFNVALAGDLVFKDPNANLVDGDRAFEGVLAAFYQDSDDNMLGLYGVYRDQRRNTDAPLAQAFDEKLQVWVMDSAGRFNAKIPGARGHVFGGYEVAYVLGKTNYVRTLTQTQNNTMEDVRQLGAAARLGAVTTAGQGDQRWGDFVASLEWGWASGDANPNDGVEKRFTFDPNHNVGLIIFNEALAWKTARAATIAEDPGLSARPSPGANLLPTNGGVAGATYLNPTIVVRPVRQLDLKGGAVIAQTTADFVDPVYVGTNGRFRNYDRGSPKSHDLGLELDAGFEYRLALDYGMKLQLGAQGGVFFPGGAFTDGAGHRMDDQYIGVGRLGLQY